MTTSRSVTTRPAPLRRLLLVLLAAVALVAVPAPPLARAESSEDWRISRYHVTADVGADGTTAVTVDLDFDFGSDPGHGPLLLQPTRQRIEADPDHWRSFPIEQITAASPSGAPADLHLEHSGGVQTIRVGDEDVEVSGVQTYRISWLQRGLVTPEAVGSGLDELAWNVVGTEYEVPLSDVRVTVTGPVPPQRVECAAGEPGETSPCADARTEDRRAVFAEDLVEPGQGLTVTTGWPAGTVDAQVLLTERAHLGNTFTPTPATIGVGALLAVLGSLAAALLARRGRDERFAGITPGLSPVATATATTTTSRRRGPVAVRFTPPDGARAAEVGTVLDEVVHTHDVTAALVDLAVRGHLRIVEDPSGTEKKPVWRLERLPAPEEDLAEHERALLEGVFADGDEVALADVGFASILSATQAALYTDVVERGWFRADPRAVRTRWYVAGILLVLLGVGLALLLAFTVAWGIAGLGVVVAGVATLVLAGRAPARTAAGSALLDQALGFKLYLSTAEADQIRVEEAEQVFSRYLPYAIAFGVTDHWAKVFRDLAARGHELGTPGWYVGAHPLVFASPTFGDQLSSFSAAVSSSVTASASSGGGSGFGAGVGGGVGGGGGGGW
ncbi:DUF2207 domain-containing protein [Auraticoccus sp. F435]|uniref:DUF2207 domain-containing protein n=1 Tax=Auraticoccus cholistanensis TaxID=2656650 RepID=A0A6A9UVT8_9ACTN|nr:DUF2207 domain-containing protein [Auraticoccus cholistanensis]MVA75684.1 DUF2207 domain-containing protein [Auraticoccus cholistanensis]